MTKEETDRNLALWPTQLGSLAVAINVFVEADKPNGQVIYSNLFTKAFGAYAASAQSDGNYVFCSSIM